MNYTAVVTYSAVSLILLNHATETTMRGPKSANYEMYNEQRAQHATQHVNHTAVQLQLIVNDTQLSNGNSNAGTTSAQMMKRTTCRNMRHLDYAWADATQITHYELLPQWDRMG